MEVEPTVTGVMTSHNNVWIPDSRRRCDHGRRGSTAHHYGHMVSSILHRRDFDNRPQGTGRGNQSRRPERHTRPTDDTLLRRLGPTARDTRGRKTVASDGSGRKGVISHGGSSDETDIDCIPRTASTTSRVPLPSASQASANDSSATPWRSGGAKGLERGAHDDDVITGGMTLLSASTGPEVGRLMKHEPCARSWYSGCDPVNAGSSSVRTGHAVVTAFIFTAGLAMLIGTRPWRERIRRIGWHRRWRSSTRIKPCRWICGQRRRQSRGGGNLTDPSTRMRARCRKVEAILLAGLVISLHVTAWLGRHHLAARHLREYPHPAAATHTMNDYENYSCRVAKGIGCGRIGPAETTRSQHGQALRRAGEGGVEGRAWWTRATRIGEASHPGPTAATVAAAGLLRRVVGTVGVMVRYAMPGTGSLRGAIAPGFGSQAAAGEDSDHLALRIESVNTTGWRSLQRRLISTRAHILLAQETWLGQDAVHAASAWARRKGWKSVWTSAQPGPGGGASGGAAIFVRAEFGMRYPPGGTHEWRPGRVVAAVADVPGHRPLLLASAYLVHGIGPGPENVEILGQMGRRLQAIGEGYEVVVGGDFNMEPPDLSLTGFEAETDLVALYPCTVRGTYRTARSASLLDYFAISGRAVAAVQAVEAVEASGVKGHTPVQITFRPRATTTRALHIRRPPRLERERVYGPLPPPPAWADARAAAEEALRAARDRRPDVQQKLDDAYRRWADRAEEELADRAGQPPKKFGERGKIPRFIWRSVLPETAPKIARPYAAAAAWLGGILNEVKRIEAEMGGNETAEVANDDIGADPNMDGDGVEVPGSVRTAEETRRARARRPPTSVAACTKVLEEIAVSLRNDLPDCGDYVGVDNIAEVRDRVLLTVESLLRIAADRAANDEGGGAMNDARGADDGPAYVLRNSIEELKKEVAEIETRYTAEGDAADQRKWREWIAEGIDRGAGRAHAYSRSPTAWMPTVEELPDGEFSAAVDVLMEGQRDKYRKLWRPSQLPFTYDWPERDELPRMTVGRLREVAGTFSNTTSTTYDGFHPRDLSYLSDEALETLATIYATVELAAMWPRQVAMIIASMLPKPQGGFRPIGMAPAVYRLWSKSRRVEADQWERDHSRSFFSACRGNGPLDTVWRLAARQEAGVAEDEVAGTISEDVQAFFESLDRDKLVEEARALNFPIPILKAALAAYSSARVISMHGLVCRELHPTVGVVAGCSLAMVLTKLYCLRAMDRFVAAAPATVHLDSFVDDLVLSAVGTPTAVLDDLMSAHAMLVAMVRDELRCTIAAGKTAVSATTRALAAAITRGVGLAGGVRATSTILGVDNTAAAPRIRLRMRSKRSARLKAAMARKKRLKQIQRAVGHRARKIYTAGVQPQATYGAAIWGLDDGEVRRLRRLAAAALRPQGRCRSLRTTMLWHDLPTATAEIAPIVQLSRVVWNAIARRGDAEMRGATVADLRRWWEAAYRQVEPTVRKLEDRMKAAQERDEEVPIPFSRSLWKRIRGPIGAAALTAARLGWRFTGPFAVTGRDGEEFLLTNTTPALVQKMAKDALRARTEKEIAAKMAILEPQFFGRRACIDLVAAAVKQDKTLSTYQRGIMRAVACGALMTGDRAIRQGYQVDGLCPLCRHARDTLTHRVYECPHSRAVVKEAVPDWFWHEAQRSAAGNSFWTTGICPSPVDLAPLPEAALNVVVEDLRAGGRPAGEELVALCGRVYFDGSCTTPAVRGLARASCSIVQTDDNGVPEKILQAAVPRHLPQTAQAAEFLGCAISIHSTRGPSIITGDCINVVNAANGCVRNSLAPSKAYAGLVLAMIADPDRRRQAGTIRWTKAHRSISGNESRDELRDIRGNEAADKAAKGAVELHPAIGMEATTQLQFYEKRARYVARAVVAALQLFPRAPGNMPRAPQPETRQQAIKRKRHLWQHRGGAWRCAICHDWSNAPQLPRSRKLQRCRGKSLFDDAAAVAQKGHRLYRVEAEVPFAFCGQCGAWSHKRSYRLSSTCGPPTAAGSQALRRIGKGLHPMQKRGRQGTLRRRERVRTVARFCHDEGRWIWTGAAIGRNQSSDLVTDGGSCHAPAHLDGAQPLAELSADAWQRGCGEDIVDYIAPYEDAAAHDEQFIDEDVFGHGGDLDQEMERAPLDAPREGSMRAETPLRDATVSGHGARSGKRGVTSMWEHSDTGTARAAIERMMAGSRPSCSDPAERLRAVKRRVAERVSARSHGAPNASGTEEVDLAHGAGGDTHALRSDCMDHNMGDHMVRGDALPKVDRCQQQTDSATILDRCDYDGDGKGGSHAAAGSNGAQGSEGNACLQKDAEADDAARNVHVDAACAGPGGPRQRRMTVTITTPPCALVVDTVAVGGAAATLEAEDHAQMAAAICGEAADSPPCGSAVPQDGISGTVGSTTGRDDARTLQRKPRGNGGGGPPKRRRLISPQKPPRRLGVGPSTCEREGKPQDGKRSPGDERRRVGSVDPGAIGAAARDSGGAAAHGHLEKPLKGFSHRATRVARKSECPNSKQGDDDGVDVHGDTDPSVGNGQASNCSHAIGASGSSSNSGSGVPGSGEADRYVRCVYDSKEEDGDAHADRDGEAEDAGRRARRRPYSRLSRLRVTAGKPVRLKEEDGDEEETEAREDRGGGISGEVVGGSCHQPRHRRRRGSPPQGALQGDRIDVNRLTSDRSIRDNRSGSTSSVRHPSRDSRAPTPPLRDEPRYHRPHVQEGEQGADAGAHCAVRGRRGGGGGRGHPLGERHCRGGEPADPGGEEHATGRCAVGSPGGACRFPVLAEAAAVGSHPVKRRRIRGKQPAAGGAAAAVLAVPRVMDDGDPLVIANRRLGAAHMHGGGEPEHGAARSAARGGPSRLPSVTSTLDRSAAHNRDGQDLAARRVDGCLGWMTNGGRPPDRLSSSAR